MKHAIKQIHFVEHREAPTKQRIGRVQAAA